MKEATGELNMTVVTIIAIGAVIAFFWVMWPNIKKTIEGTWNGLDNSACTGGYDEDGNCLKKGTSKSTGSETPGYINIPKIF